MTRIRQAIKILNFFHQHLKAIVGIYWIVCLTNYADHEDTIGFSIKNKFYRLITNYKSGWKCHVVLRFMKWGERMKKGKQYVTDLVNLLKREPGDSSTKLRVSFRKKPKRTPPNLDKERMVGANT